MFTSLFNQVDYCLSLFGINVKMMDTGV